MRHLFNRLSWGQPKSQTTSVLAARWPPGDAAKEAVVTSGLTDGLDISLNCLNLQKNKCSKMLYHLNKSGSSQLWGRSRAEYKAFPSTVPALYPHPRPQPASSR
ncbi:unnamed protein product [Leuciscus chuanchicus]